MVIGLADGRIQFWRNVDDDGPQFGDPVYLQVGDVDSKTDIDLGDRATLDIVDWNNDGLYDLITGDLDGRIHLFLNQAPTGAADFYEGLVINAGCDELTVPTGRASVAVADLNRDGRKDLIAGNTEGQLWFYPNGGSDIAPMFGSGQLLQATGADIDLPGTPRSRPFVGDLDSDGVLDLLLGAEDGRVRFYEGNPTSPTSVPIASHGIPGDEFIYTFDSTLDLAPPTSHVLRLPSTTDAEFVVEWTGQDGLLGSGIAHFDIYYAVDDGDYVIWLDNTTKTSSLFPGRPGHTYSFYSRCGG